ncbi:hypothetical protein [Erwinia sp. V71]|uniref:hypothetical protein n=1 Tax=Erwinia sp. V71 TaxID=3369424 RepID=UPI003F5DE654
MIHQGYSAHLAGLLMAFCVVTQLLTSLLFSVVTRLLHISRARAPLVFALLTLAGALVMAGNLSPWLASLLLGMGTGGLFPIALILPLDFTVTKSQATRLSGMTQSGGYLLGGVIPWLVGVLAQQLGMRTGLQMALLFLTLAITLVALLIASAYRQRDTHTP